MNNKQRMLMAMRGEMPDQIPFAPRLDLWFLANRLNGTLPSLHQHCTHHFEVAQAEGWGIHQTNPAYQEIRKPEDNLHWGLGILSYKEMVFGFRFGGDMEIGVDHQPGGRTRIIYRTLKGTVSTTTIYTEEMRRSGTSAPIIEEHVLKRPKETMPRSVTSLRICNSTSIVKILSHFSKPWARKGWLLPWPAEQHRRCIISRNTLSTPPIFFHYKDYAKEMAALAEFLSPFFDQTIEIIGRSPAEAVYWGANFDDMITYPEYFAKDIAPWIKKAAEALGQKNIIVSCHCDGENKGLMDLIRDSGLHVAESVCPYPMTKVSIDEYYERWSDQLTIFGGIPSNLLLKETTSEEEFEAFIDYLFNAIAPGKRIIISWGFLHFCQQPCPK